MAIEKVALELIDDNPYQSRQTYHKQDIDDLAASIKLHGLLQVPPARRKDSRVELGFGHLRKRAFIKLSKEDREAWGKMPLDIRDLTDEQMALFALEENLKRKDLNPIDLARSYRRYLDEFKVTQEQLASQIGISQPTLANTIRLLELPDQVQEMIISQEITATHGRELLKLKGEPEQQVRLAREVKKSDLNVRELSRNLTSAVRDKWRALSDSSWPRPKFDLKGCQGCDQVETLDTWDGPKPYCKNAKCWEGKQKAAEAEERKKEEAEMKKKYGGKEIVALDKIGWNKYKDFDHTQLDHPEECETCEHRKVGKTSYGDPREVCLNPRCFTQKQSKATRERNRQQAEDYQALLNKARAAVDLEVAFTKPVCLIVLEAIMDGDEEKEVAKSLGLQPKGNEWRQEFAKKLREQADPELRWLLVRAALDRMHRMDVYTGRNERVAKAVGIISSNSEG